MTVPAPNLLEFLRQCGVALCLAGEAASQIPGELEAIADAYGVADVHFLIIPTGVFVKMGSGETATLDFAEAVGSPLRLDQVDAVHKLMTAVKANPVPPDEAIERLNAILASPPRFNALVQIGGYALHTLGLGMILIGNKQALLSLVLLGAFVGALRWVSQRVAVLSLALPVAAALLVAFLAYKFGPELGADPSSLIIPPLVSFLPGAALTMGAVEMATGSMISGASRLVFGIYMLLLLTFGIIAGVNIAHGEAPTTTASAPAGWMPWAGVLIFALGTYFSNSAPKRSMPWLIVMLYTAFAVQFVVGRIGDSLAAAFMGGLVIVPIATLVQRLNGPPAQVAFLPAFWLLVPGALGLAGVSGLIAVGKSTTSSLSMAFLTVVAVALGVLVGSSLTSTATATLRLETSRSV